ncbi:TAXI family TRAP transporter solute-binding subunit (plasmid) [Skermanella mucosa]|uniref:TAXI family TRAP transporter solute-binding subunit n=1 Tax=Skermanella mucosa TaxID=1789672 RepID=UPI00192C4F22|nr:TAXI family TRAP transporter solute-binding subunit [Skermanella mucosa]UEM25194.1 TAXI family TRAP transporter solute-binding subunit [Skermanella mucosa]
MTSKNSTFKRAVLGTAVALGTGLAAGGAGAETFRLMTGPQGGSWYPLGGAIQNIIQKAVPGSSVQVQPGAGIINAIGVENGKAELGFGNSVSTVDAVHGRDPFKAKAENLCQIASLYFQYFQVVAPKNMGIDSVDDLKGKAIAVQPRGNTAEQMSRDLLETYGLSYDDMSKVNFVSYTDAVSLMQDGHIQGFTLITTIPASSIMDLATSRDISVLNVPDESLEKLRSKNEGYDKRTIAAGTYPKQEDDVQTFGTWTHLFGSCKMPEQTAYSITKALAENLDNLSGVVSALKGLDVKQMATDVGVPFHPGAEKYYREQNAL